MTLFTLSRNRLKWVLMVPLTILILLMAFVFGCNVWVTNAVADRQFALAKDLPYRDVALVLGTNPRIYKNIHNPYFVYRIEAAAELYHSGKVKHLILSGDNSELSYNEPVEMQKALIEKGVPAEAISLDYAGFRTLDSVVRCHQIFQQRQFTIISQQFHTYRALFIADYYGLETIAFNAAEPTGHSDSKTKIREYLARCKAVLDLYVLHKKPKYLGEKIDIIIQ